MWYSPICHERGRAAGRSKVRDIGPTATGSPVADWLEKCFTAQSLCLFPISRTHEPGLCTNARLFFLFLSTQTERTASGPWEDSRWLWKKVYWIWIADSTFRSKFFSHSTTCCINTHLSLPKTDCIHFYTHQCMCPLCYTLKFRCLCSTVLSLHCVGRCVRYTCWQTRFLCVRLSGSGCLTPAAPLVWRQVRGGHISTVSSDPLPCDPSYCHGNSNRKPLTSSLTLKSTALNPSYLWLAFVNCII